MTIPELLKWLRTTDGWFVDKYGRIARIHPGDTYYGITQCPGSARFDSVRVTAGIIAERTGLSYYDAYEVVLAADCADFGNCHYDRNLRRRLARACKVRLSERQ